MGSDNEVSVNAGKRPILTYFLRRYVQPHCEQDSPIFIFGVLHFGQLPRNFWKLLPPLTISISFSVNSTPNFCSLPFWSCDMCFMLSSILPPLTGGFIVHYFWAGCLHSKHIRKGRRAETCQIHVLARFSLYPYKISPEDKGFLWCLLQICTNVCIVTFDTHPLLFHVKQIEMESLVYFSCKH